MFNSNSEKEIIDFHWKGWRKFQTVNVKAQKCVKWNRD